MVKDAKTAIFTFRTTPRIKRALDKLAADEHRSLNSQLELIVIEYLEGKGYLR